MTDELKEILEKAVEIEEDSFRLYTAGQKKTKFASSKNFLKELADMELEHKRKLLSIMNNKTSLGSLGLQKGKLEDLRIVDYMKDITRISDDAEYQEILTYAAQREKKTHDYYVLLAKSFQGSNVGDLFQKLAEEELAHKIRLEKEYDDWLSRNE